MLLLEGGDPRRVYARVANEDDSIDHAGAYPLAHDAAAILPIACQVEQKAVVMRDTVSYTHLTLPTKA
jgi:hypothetical protein